MSIIKDLQQIFNSISCLTVEGPEFHTKLELCDAIAREAGRGYNLCKDELAALENLDRDYFHKVS